MALAEAIALLGDAGAADELYRRLAPFGGRVVVTNTGLLFGGAVDHWLGRVAVTAGSQAEARRHLEAAMVAHARMGARPLLARTRLHLAELLQDGGKPATRSGRWPCWRAAWPTPGCPGLTSTSSVHIIPSG